MAFVSWHSNSCERNNLRLCQGNFRLDHLQLNCLETTRVCQETKFAFQAYINAGRCVVRRVLAGGGCCCCCWKAANSARVVEGRRVWPEWQWGAKCEVLEMRECSQVNEGRWICRRGFARRVALVFGAAPLWDASGGRRVQPRSFSRLLRGQLMPEVCFWVFDAEKRWDRWNWSRQP